ncbi:MAG: MFS transporter [Planctomycetota bacterium]
MTGDVGNATIQGSLNADSFAAASAEPNVFGRSFWFCYLSNAMLMIGVSVLFRYADFVMHLGGNERHLGVIVGVGMIGGLAVRVLLGAGIDRYGPRRIWIGSLLLFTLAALAHLSIQTVYSPAVYAARILLTIGIAGSVGASLTYVSLRVPESRIAEMVGTLGTSGFLGLAIGPALGDLLFGTSTITRGHIDRMFFLAAFAGGVAVLAAIVATRGHVRAEAKSPSSSLVPVIRRYQPGMILLVAFAVGVGIGLPAVFVRAYAVELEITGIQSYFLVYAAVAFVVRVATRRLTQHIGIRPVILMGLGSLSASMVFYLVVREAWQLAIPAVFAGSAHALLFPAIVSGGTTSFPSRHRGLATTLVLGVLDSGKLVGQPTIGNILYYADELRLPKYPTMFLLVALFVIVVGVVYFTYSRVGRRRAVAWPSDSDAELTSPRVLDCPLQPETMTATTVVDESRFRSHSSRHSPANGRRHD